jgi:hypothetical protein
MGDYWLNSDARQLQVTILGLAYVPNQSGCRRNGHVFTRPVRTKHHDAIIIRTSYYSLKGCISCSAHLVELWITQSKYTLSDASLHVIVRRYQQIHTMGSQKTMARVGILPILLSRSDTVDFDKTPR